MRALARLWLRIAPALLAATALSGQTAFITKVETTPSPINQLGGNHRVRIEAVVYNAARLYATPWIKVTYDRCVLEQRYGSLPITGTPETLVWNTITLNVTGQYCSRSTPADAYPRLQSIEVYVVLAPFGDFVDKKFGSPLVYVPFERRPEATVSPRTFELTEKIVRTKARLTVNKGLVEPGSITNLRLYRANDLSKYVGWLPTALFRCEAFERITTKEGFGICDAVPNGHGVDFEVITLGNLKAAEYEGSYTAVLTWQESGKEYVSQAVGQGAVTIGSSSLGPPTVSEGGVVDAAQYKPVVSPCGIGAAFGTNMSDRVNQAGQLPLPTDLNGVNILINGVKAPLFFVSENQINFQVPCEAPETGNLSVVIDRNGQRSAAGSAKSAAAAPGVFIDTDTNLPIVLLVARRSQEGQEHVGKLISSSNPARPGDTLTVFLSGIGRGSPPVRTGEAVQGISHSVQKVEINVGGTQMTVLFAGYTPRFAGLAQVNFEIPAGAFTKTTSQPSILSVPSLLPFVLRVGSAETPPIRFPVLP